jgi:hypothetical protein
LVAITGEDSDSDDNYRTDGDNWKSICLSKGHSIKSSDRKALLPLVALNAVVL